MVTGPLAAVALGWSVSPWAGVAAAMVVGAVFAWWAIDARRRIGALAAVIEAGGEELAQARDRIAEAEQQRSELHVQARIAQSQQRRLLDVLNAFNDAVIVTDTFNELTLANDSAKRLLNIARDAAACPIDQVLNDGDLVKLIKDTREGGRLLRRHLERHLTTGDRTGIFDVSAGVIADANPTGVNDQGVITIFRDVTRQREIDEMKNEFVSNVSHELRTPLASIQAYLEMLVDGEATDEAARGEFYEIMQAEAGRLSRLIENMLNISRIEAGLVHIDRQAVALPALIDEAIDVLRPQAHVKQLELGAEPSAAKVRVEADRDMILQVLVNLIGNAIKYTPSGGGVSVGWIEDAGAGQVRVWVRDTGPGIPEADIPRLFEKFYRSAAHSRTARGTGLGLSLVRRVIEELHGGRVEVKSQVGRGSTFTFTLPLADPTIGGAG